MTTSAQDRPRVSIIGTGWTGALAAKLIHQHPKFSLDKLLGKSDAGERFERIYPSYGIMRLIRKLDPATIDSDAVIVTLPQTQSAPVVAELLQNSGGNLRIVDLSADFRLPQETYEQWYGAQHPHPELLSHAIYGLPELYRDQIRNTQLVANPGCYPTAALLSLAPLARAKLIEHVVIDAAQGLSGAGRNCSLDIRERSREGIFPYSVTEHRHIPEIEQVLRGLGADLPVTLQTSLIAAHQGEMVKSCIIPTKTITKDAAETLFTETYSKEPFVRLTNRAPKLCEIKETNFCSIHVTVDPRTGFILVVSSLDNLWKGAVSQAVQNLNLMFGYDERTGLLPRRLWR